MKRISIMVVTLAGGCVFGSGKTEPTDVVPGEEKAFATIRTTDAGCAPGSVAWGVVRPPVEPWDVAALGTSALGDSTGFVGARGDGNELIVDFGRLNLGSVNGPGQDLDPDWVSSVTVLPGPVEVWDAAIADSGPPPEQGLFVATQGFVLTNFGVLECAVTAQASATGVERREAGCVLGGVQDAIVAGGHQPVHRLLVSGGCNQSVPDEGGALCDGREEFVLGLINGTDRAYGLDIVSGWNEGGELETRTVPLPDSIATRTDEDPAFDYSPHFAVPLTPEGIGFPRLAFLEKTADGVRPRTTTYDQQNQRYEADASADAWDLPAALRGVLPTEFAFTSNLTANSGTRFGFAGFDRDGVGLILSRPDGFPDAPHARWEVDDFPFDDGAVLSFVRGVSPLGVVGSGSQLLVFNWDVENDRVHYQRVEMEGATDVRPGGGVNENGAAALVGEMTLDGRPAVWVVPVPSVQDFQQAFCND